MSTTTGTDPSHNMLDVPFQDNFDGLTDAEAAARLKLYGPNDTVPTAHTCRMLVMRAVQPMPALFVAASIFEFFEHRWLNASLLVATALASCAGSPCEDALTLDDPEPSATRAAEAVVFRERRWQTVPRRNVVPGDRVQLNAGTIVVADCTLNDRLDARLDVDMSYLTGERQHTGVTPGSSIIFASSVVVRGQADATVQYTGKRTAIHKIVRHLGTPKVTLTRIWRVPHRFTAVLAFVACVALIVVSAMSNHVGWRDAVQGAICLAYVAVPWSLVPVLRLLQSFGERALRVRHGVVVVSGDSVDALSSVDMLLVDKTGTLTKNGLGFTPQQPYVVGGHTQETLIVFAALASSGFAAATPRDAIERMVLDAAPREECGRYRICSHRTADPLAFHCSTSLLCGPDGGMLSVARGSVSGIRRLTNSTDVWRDLDSALLTGNGRGERHIAVAVSRGLGSAEQTPVWELMGVLSFHDPVRVDARAALSCARRHGIAVKMVTGDRLAVAAAVGAQLGLGPNFQTSQAVPELPVSGALTDQDDTPGVDEAVERFGPFIECVDGFATLYSSHKYALVQVLRRRGWNVAITGDGVGDAPALKIAAAGIAVHGATDAARTASKAICTRAGVAAIVEALLDARCIVQTMSAYVTHRVAATTHLALLYFIAVAWGWWIPTQLPLPLCFTIVTVCEAVAVSGIDEVACPSATGQLDDRRIILVGVVSGSIGAASSLVLVWMALDSYRNFESSWFFDLGLPPCVPAQSVTLIFMHVTASLVLTHLSLRCEREPWYAHRLGWLRAALCIAALGAASLGAWLPSGSLDEVAVLGVAQLSSGEPESTSQRLMPIYVLCYSTLWWFLQDAAKVAIFHSVKAFPRMQWLLTAGTLRKPHRTVPLEVLGTVCDDEGSQRVNDPY